MISRIPPPAPGVSPYIPGRPSLTRLQAIAIRMHPRRDKIPPWLTEEADDVIERGEHWRTK